MSAEGDVNIKNDGERPKNDPNDIVSFSRNAHLSDFFQ